MNLRNHGQKDNQFSSILEDKGLRLIGHKHPSPFIENK
jgi:hypothetical protein